MKKLLFLSIILSALISTTTYAQPAGDPAITPTPAEMLQKAKELQKPGLITKVGLTDVQAEKLIEINFESRQQAATVLKGLNEADRSAKLAELKAAKEKKYSEILTPEQIKAVYAYYEEMGKNSQNSQRKIK